MSSQDIRPDALEMYAWPGGYPVTYWDAETDNFCGSCAAALIAYDPDITAASFTSGIVWEGPNSCTDCGRQLVAYPEA